MKLMIDIDYDYYKILKKRQFDSLLNYEQAMIVHGVPFKPYKIDDKKSIDKEKIGD